MADPHITVWGAGPPVLLVHGSNAADPDAVWKRQRPLAARWQLRALHRRGYGRSASVPKPGFGVDVADIIAALGSGAHIVGFSYGGVLALLAVARRPELARSLTLIEPPAYAVAANDPAVERTVARMAPLFMPPLPDEDAFIRGFRRALDLPVVEPLTLSAADRQGIRATLAEPPPHLACIPLAALATAPFRTLIVSGDWNPGLEAVADTLTARLGAERARIPGAGHSVQATGHPFNARLEAFLRTTGRDR